MPVQLALPGRSFLRSAMLRRPLPDVARALSDHRPNAARMLARRILRLAIKQGVPFASNDQGYWTRIRIEEVDAEIGLMSPTRAEFRVIAGGQCRMEGRFHLKNNDVTRLRVATWLPGEWQKRLFRRTVTP